jgi:hypothetical protein
MRNIPPHPSACERRSSVLAQVQCTCHCSFMLLFISTSPHLTLNLSLTHSRCHHSHSRSTLERGVDDLVEWQQCSDNDSIRQVFVLSWHLRKCNSPRLLEHGERARHSQCVRHNTCQEHAMFGESEIRCVSL